ncbi:TerC/Alx family metal homeostasis membrane protein [Limnobaculum parvum]|uniref:Tellurium resistance protein TerC n=1 Tax=Limnobaculum parvum TaxID=2172103 RepID=A0A2Y9U037_9GAMM|nr:TerC/Alx family metal homeostasis membrane protein [Limnobaculum parvum]AWH89305.1 tellurium resistance protein TerC [Limnobaculum parvum]
MEQTSLGFPPLTVTVFIVLAISALAIDLIAHRKDKPISLKNASIWCLFWLSIGLGFGGFLYVQHGVEIASLYLTGYALEEVLSVDNLFVIMAIFAWFKIPHGYRHRVLYWGIIGAIVFRGIFVVIGTGLLALGPWVEMLFAVIVFFTAVMMLRANHDGEEIEDYSRHPANRLVRRFFPVYPKLVGNHFLLSAKEVKVDLSRPENKDFVFHVKKNVRYATPLFLCVAVVELSDVMFAFDSVPAVIAVSREPLIVYSAMMFAVLGLRTIYFVLEALRNHLVHLEKAVIFLLFFVSFKLGLNASEHIWHHGYEIGATASLGVVLTALAVGILSSFIFPAKDDK